MLAAGDRRKDNAVHVIILYITDVNTKTSNKCIYRYVNVMYYSYNESKRGALFLKCI